MNMEDIADVYNDTTGMEMEKANEKELMSNYNALSRQMEKFISPMVASFNPSMVDYETAGFETEEASESPVMKPKTVKAKRAVKAPKKTTGYRIRAVKARKRNVPALAAKSEVAVVEEVAPNFPATVSGVA